MTMNQILVICATVVISSTLLPAQGNFTSTKLDSRSTSHLFQVSTLDALTLGLYGVFIRSALSSSREISDSVRLKALMVK